MQTHREDSHRPYSNLCMTGSPRLLKSFVPAILEPFGIGIHNPPASNVDSSIGSSHHTPRGSAVFFVAFSRNSGAFPPSLLACLCVGPLGAFAAPKNRKSPFSGWFRSTSGSCHWPVCGRFERAASGWYYLDSTRHRWRSVAEEARERVVVPVPETKRAGTAMGVWMGRRQRTDVRHVVPGVLVPHSLLSRCLLNFRNVGSIL